MGKKQVLTNFNPDEFKVVDNPIKSDNKPITDFNPNEFKIIGGNNSIPHINDLSKALDENKTPEENNQKANEIIDNLKFSTQLGIELPYDTDYESKKETLKNLVKKGVNKEQLSESILTLQGKHPKQDGGVKYYIDNNGLPKPLANDEKPPKEYDIASAWGSKTEANDDNILTSTAKHLWNGMIGAAEGVVSLPETIYGLSTGDDSSKAQSLKNAASTLKFETPEKEKEQLLNTEGMTSFKDILDPDRWTPTAGNIQGQILNGLESVVSFALGRGLGTAKTVSKGGQKVLSAVSAYNMSLNQMLDVADEAGLEGRDKYAFAGAAAIPQAALEGFTGIGGLLTKNQAAKAEMKNLAKIAGENLERDVAGNLTKESLDKLNKEMTIASTFVAKKYAGKVVKNIGEEAATETLQQFAEESSKQLYDKLKEDPKFNADAFSPESVGKYINSAIGGALGSGGPALVLTHKSQQIEQENERSKSAYAVSQQGEEAIKNFTKNVENEVKNGGLTREQADNAIVKINAYKEYHDQTQDLNLPDEQKRKVFDYTFQKSDLLKKIANIDKEKLNGIELAKYHGLEQQAKDLQQNINEIVLKAQLENETTVADKTLEKQAKDQEIPEKWTKTEKKIKLPPELEEEMKAHEDKYKVKPKPETLKPEERSYNDIPKEEFNSEKFNARVKHEKLADYLETIPDKKTEGKLVEKKYVYGNKENSTYAVKLPDGKIIKLASSMERPEQFRGHMRTEHLLNEKDLVGFPVGVKVEYLPEGKRVIKVYNGKTGKFISWAKETNTGKKSTVNDLQIEQLSHLETIKEPPISGNETNIKPEVVTPLQPQTDLNVQTNNGKEENTTRGEKSTEGNNKEIISNDIKKTKKFTTGTKRANRKIKSPEFKKALSHEVFTPHELAMQYFIGKGLVSSESVRKLLKSGKEVFARGVYAKKQGGPTIEQIAEKIVAENENLPLDLQDVVNAIEDVIISHNNPSSMAKALNSAYNVEEQEYSESERELNEGAELANEAGLGDEFDKVIDLIEEFGDDKIIHLTQEDINKIIDENESDIIGDDGEGDQFQKTKDKFIKVKDFKTEEGNFSIYDTEKDPKGRAAMFTVLKDKKGYIVRNVIIPEDLKRQGLSTEFYSKINEESIDKTGNPLRSTQERTLNNGEKVHELSKDGIALWDSFVKKGLAKKLGEKNYIFIDSDQLQRQKGGKGNVDLEHHEKVLEITKHIQKSLPNIEVKLNPKLRDKKGNAVAGVLKASGKTIEINPYYSGLDTPIHEAGHVLIDAIGYDNKVIQEAFKQLKNTKLADETRKRYSDENGVPELSEEMMNKEILAEAIGREGAGIFDTEIEKSKFKQLLDYIFNWFKRKLGLEKNVAKSLAKQIIGGIGTKNIGGKESKIDQEQNSKPIDVIKAFDEANTKKGLKRKEAFKDLKNKFPNLASKAKEITDNFKNIVEELKQTQNLIEKC